MFSQGGHHDANNVKISKSQFIDTCINKDIRDDYEVHKQIGKGAFGIAYLVSHRVTGEKRAVKAVTKAKLEDAEAFRSEVALLRTLDHPNIVKLYEIYEFRNVIYLVMEYCEGGELFGHIAKTKHLTELQAAKIMRQLFSAVVYMHSNRIIHRDLKPENCLLKFDNDISLVKIIDFGMAQQLREDERLTSLKGTPYYVAPEVLDKYYTESADNWSVGVMLYIMVSGRPPFTGNTPKEILGSIQRGVFTFSFEPFKDCSLEVKDLISKLLVKDVKNRYTASESYKHPWIQWQVSRESKDLVIPDKVIQTLQDFMEQQSFKQAIMLYIAQQIPEEQLHVLRQYFTEVDQDGNGVLTHEELLKGFEKLKQSGTNVPIDQTKKLLTYIDANMNGVIDYSEFIAIFMDSYVIKNERYLRIAFEKFDRDKSGKISRAELVHLLSGGDIVPMSEIDKTIELADVNKDGEIDFNEVLRYIKLRI